MVVEDICMVEAEFGVNEGVEAMLLALRVLTSALWGLVLAK